jgi:DNA-binding GntR family transcriptional regulator
MAFDPRQAAFERPLAWSPNPGASALSLAEQIAEQIGNAIIRGELPPGERVREEEVAGRFSVSRGPVREALRILERDGLIRIQARRGARVTQLTVDEVDEVFELRCALLGVAARRVAEHGDRAVNAKLKAGVEVLRRLSRGDDSDAYVSTAHGLNMTIADASGSDLLRGMYFSLAYRTLRYTRLSLASERRRGQSARKWKLLASAIEAGDAVGAGQLAETLVRDSRNAVVAILRAQSTEGNPLHEESADRQPRRDRLPDLAKLPRARPSDSRGLL